MSYSLKTLKNTWFKQGIEQAVNLSLSQKVLINGGQLFPVSSVASSPSGHIKFSLGKDGQGTQITLQGRNTWYAYLPDVLVLQDGKPFEAVVKSGARAIGAAGLELLKAFEGCELTSYLCPAGIWTIGYGSTKDVYPGQNITQAEAEALLKKDLQRFEAAVDWMVTVPIDGSQYDALVSFAYNVGEGALQGSTLLRLLNQGDYAGCAEQFGRWVNGGGGALQGLVRRRKAERSLFLSQNYTQYL